MDTEPSVSGSGGSRTVVSDGLIIVPVFQKGTVASLIAETMTVRGSLHGPSRLFGSGYRL